MSIASCSCVRCVRCVLVLRRLRRKSSAQCARVSRVLRATESRVDAFMVKTEKFKTSAWNRASTITQRSARQSRTYCRLLLTDEDG